MAHRSVREVRDNVLAYEAAYLDGAEADGALGRFWVISYRI